MIKNSKIKARIKNFLIGLNIVLGIFLLLLILFWLLQVRPNQIAEIEQAGHYKYYTMDNLPTVIKAIEVDLLKKQQNVAQNNKLLLDDDDILLNEETPEEELFSDKRLDNIKLDYILPNERVFDKADELLLETNKILDKPEVEDTANPIYKANPKIAIIVTNLGLKRRLTELAMTLPTECALGFLPYTKSLKSLLHKAQSNGHEIYLYLPSQTKESFDNPGKYALMPQFSDEENSIRLGAILNSHARYDGVYSNYKEIFTEDAKASQMLFEHLNDKNLIFILGKSFQGELYPHIKNYNNIIRVTSIIDMEPDKEVISKNLEEMIETAKIHGTALGYVQGFTLTIEMIRDWIPQLKEQGIELVTISELLKEMKLSE